MHHDAQVRALHAEVPLPGPIEILAAMFGGGLCGLTTAGLLLGLLYLSRQSKTSTQAQAGEPAGPPSKVIKLGAAAPGSIRAEPPTLPTEPGAALDTSSIDLAALAVQAAQDAQKVNDDTWDDGEPLTQLRTLPEHVDLDELTGKVVLTSGAGVLMEDPSGRREWTAPRVHADVAPSIWIDEWGPLKPEELVRFAKHYRQVDRVQFEAPERLPTLLQELGYADVGEWFRVYNTFLKHFGVGGPGDTIADYAFGQDFKDALFAAEF